MENEKNQKIGGGLLTLIIFQIISSTFGIIQFILMLLPKTKDLFNNKYYEKIISNPTLVVILLIFTCLTLISMIFLLFKNVIGIYIYFVVTALSIIQSIIFNGFSKYIFISLIFPALMAFLIYRKKHIFGLGVTA
ncbi:hypothetical protein ACFO6R_00950 [Eubacterium multiforme]|uniref:Uncharacterized protein n=1 Tax=Eubacterium multiforme TaxID=83339 RepID=A0ABT9UPW5_9FIRM|nr:hypothetical protein [Eubacterium multiforme]MDQ0148691.1 hypothetical protein [Eubacterium multiforme]